jgi:hypothetical protein
MDKAGIERTGAGEMLGTAYRRNPPRGRSGSLCGTIFIASVTWFFPCLKL